MEKKQYINPRLEVVKMRTNQYLMAGSPGSAYEEVGGGTILSREEEYDF